MSPAILPEPGRALRFVHAGTERQERLFALYPGDRETFAGLARIQCTTTI